MKIIKIFLLFIAVLLGRMSFVQAAASDYAVVVSAATEQDQGWAKVVAALKKKHHAAVIAVSDPFGTECRDRLRQLQPRYVAFVARPEEVGLEYVRQIYQLSRSLDDAPYADFMWGIITAATPEAALRIAQVQKPLIVRRALSTTGINLVPLDDSLTLSDGKPGQFVVENNGRIYHGDKTNDGIPAYQRYLDYYNSNDVDLLVSSSHATELNLEMPFRDGSIVISGARMFMVDKTNLFSFVRACGGNAKSGLWFQSPGSSARRAAWAEAHNPPELRRATNPKIYIAAGNCLIGNAMNTTDSLAMDWLTYQGVDQFVGYTVTTWFGKSGWGTLKLWQDYGGQYDLATAFYLNNQMIIHKLVTDFPEADGINLDEKSLNQMGGEASGPPTPEMLKLNAVLEKIDPKQRETLTGYLYDRDVLAFYGDPDWVAKLDPNKAESPVKWHWSHWFDRYSLKIECVKNFKDDQLLILLPHRMKNARVAADAGLNVTVNDEFVSISRPDFTAGKTYRIEITMVEGSGK